MSDVEKVIPDLPRCTPPPTEEVLIYIDGLDIPEDVQMPGMLNNDISFAASRDPSSLSLTSSTEAVYSVGHTEDISNSEYSTMYPTSDYPSLFRPALRGIIRDSYGGPQSPVFSDSTTTTGSFGHSLHVMEQPGRQASLRDTIDVLPPFRALPAVSIDHPVDGMSATQAFTGPTRTKFTCLQCGHVFDRKSNLEAHMKLYNPDRARPFMCPDHGFSSTRKQDLTRHQANIDGSSTSEVSLVSQPVGHMRYK